MGSADKGSTSCLTHNACVQSISAKGHTHTRLYRHNQGWVK